MRVSWWLRVASTARAIVNSGAYHYVSGHDVDNYTEMKKPARQTIPLLTLLAFTVIGCSAEEPTPVDILHVASGACSRDENNRATCRPAKDIYRKTDDGYGWSIRFRSNRKAVHFVEEIEVSAPTTWPEPRTGFTVSNDKRSARFEGEVDGSQGYVGRIWKISSDDPDGPIKIN